MAKWTVLACILVTLCHSGKSNDCNLPPDSGSCATSSAAKEEVRYYYSAKNLKCAEMPYVGCGGNLNNFKTMSECSKQCEKKILETSMATAILAAQKESLCFFGNRTYRVGEAIPEMGTENPCRKECSCHKNATDNTPPQIKCPEINCFASYTEGCVLLQNPDECCPKTHCPGDKHSGFKCSYKGKDYLDGEAMHSDDYPCMTCHCNKNWKGAFTTEGGICKEVNCLIAMDNYWSKKHCEPQYLTMSKDKQSCCSLTWDCPL